jgi:peroxiredoxin/Tfp pilus assembly protein PilF
MIRDRRSVPCLLLILGLFVSPLAAEQADPLAGALAEAQDLMEEQKYKEAIRAFKKAGELAGGPCLDCHIGLARAYNKVGAHKDALKNAEAALQLTKDDTRLAQIYHEQGFALFVLAGDDPEKLGQAEKAFRLVLEKTKGQINAVRYNLAAVLLRLERDAEGTPLLKEYLEHEPNGPYAESARDLIANPLRARKRLVPDFELVTLAGDYVTSEDLRGKVVLLDFWATWCAPCVKAIPDLKALARRMGKQPFVLLSISADHDEPALREFVQKHDMTWPQVWDKHHEFTAKCTIRGYPTYLLVDHTGEIVFSASGWGPGIERELESKVFFAVRAARKEAKP